MNSDQYNYECRNCRGRKVVPGRILTREICSTCHGKGETDWISNAMGNPPLGPPDHDLLYQIAQRNIHDLMAEIRNQAARVGQHVEISLEFRSEREMYNRLYGQPLTINIKDLK